MRWTLQRPAKRAKERNEEAIQRWVRETWPAEKKALVTGKPGSSSRMRVVSQSVLWAPRGQTPVLIHAFNWKKMSICVALGYRWDGRRSRLWFQMKPDSCNPGSLIVFLRDRKRHMRDDRATLIWDGLPAHKSRVMSEYLRNQAK